MGKNGKKRIYYGQIKMIRFLLVIMVISSQTIENAFALSRAKAFNSESNADLSKANTLLEEGKYDAAILVYNSYLKDDSTSYDALFGLARALAFSGEHEQAIEFYSKLISLYPNDPDALLGRGRVFAWEQHFEKAEKDLSFVTRNYPDYVDAWSALGDLYLWWGKYEAALAATSCLRDLNPMDPEPYIKRAKIYQSSRQLHLARTELLTAHKLGGDEAIIDQFLRELARLPEATLWSATFFYDFENFTPKRNNWNTFTGYIKRELSFGSIILGGIKTYRFGLKDQALFLDSYFNLWRKAYGNWVHNIAINRKFLPSNYFRIEVYQSVGKGWEISGSYGHMNFPANKVDLYSIMVAKYIRDWYIRGRILWVPKYEKTGRSYSLSIRKYLGSVEDFIDFVYGWSALLNELLTEEDLERVRASSIRLRYEKSLKPYLSLFVQGSYRNDKEAYIAITRALSIGVTYRW